MKTVKTNFETLSHGLQKDRYKSKKYEWLHEIAAVNEMARTKHLSYGQFVSEAYMTLVQVPRAPKGYHTAREWAKIRSKEKQTFKSYGTGKLTLEDVLASDQYHNLFDEQTNFCYQDTDIVK